MGSHLGCHVKRGSTLTDAGAHDAHRLDQPLRLRLLWLGGLGRSAEAVVQYPHLDDVPSGGHLVKWACVY